MNLTSLYRSARALVTGRTGATALEYGLIAGLIATAIIGTVSALGTGASAMFQTIIGE